MVQTTRFSDGEISERRDYVRVTDAVGLDVRKLEAGESVNVSADELEAEFSTEGLSELKTYKLIESLRITHPDAAEHIEKLEQALGLGEGKSRRSPLAAGHPTHKVSLSGSGIAFSHDQLLQPGDRVFIGLTLFPSGQYIKLIALIISVGSVSGSVTGGKHSARAVFSRIDKSSRSTLIEHIDFVLSEM